MINWMKKIKKINTYLRIRINSIEDDSENKSKGVIFKTPPKNVDELRIN